MYFPYTKRLSHLYKDLERGIKCKSSGVYQRSEVWHCYSLPSISELLCIKHQQPCKSKYGSVQGACGSWTLTWGSFLVSAYCGGKGGWLESLTMQRVSWSAMSPPWREGQDALLQDLSARRVCAAEQIGMSHNVAALYLVC